MSDTSSAQPAPEVKPQAEAVQEAPAAEPAKASSRYKRPPAERRLPAPQPVVKDPGIDESIPVGDVVVRVRIEIASRDRVLVTTGDDIKEWPIPGALLPDQLRLGMDMLHRIVDDLALSVKGGYFSFVERRRRELGLDDRQDQGQPPAAGPAPALRVLGQAEVPDPAQEVSEDED